MFPARPASSAQQRIIIHHLSDLHYHQDSQSSEPDPLDRYMGYLEGLTSERRPHLVVITGDLTSTGNKSDLSTVAEILRKGFPRWVGDLADHILVVPGPRDINWEDSKDPPGLNAFYEAFRHFGLPSTRHDVPQSSAQANAGLNCIAYPIDTCYSLKDCRDEMKEQFHQYGSRYHEFVERYQRAQRGLAGPLGFGKRDKRKELIVLRERYLALTESNDLTLLDDGRVDLADLAAFEGWIASWGKDPRTAKTLGEPLKILITHHPLAGEPELKVSSRATRYERLANAARTAGFHLALHGHIHKPQVLSDLSLLQGPDVRHPIRQVGAGSLGDGKTFNEITATYTDMGGHHQWRLEIRTINLQAEQPEKASSFVLLDPAMTAKSPEQEALDKNRQEFDSRVRSVMRQFSEGVFRAQHVGNTDKLASVQLPQSPLQSVESIIREVVFPRFDLRVRLFLKELQYTRTVPRLNAVYLAPPNSDGSGGSGPVTYPVSLAALSLVLGKTVVCPRDLETLLDGRDDEWLRRSGKDRQLVRFVGALVEEARGTSYPGPAGAQHYEALLVKLNQGMTGTLRAADFYHEAPPGSGQRYPEFICLPFPRRSPEGVVPEMPEVATLVVSVKAPEPMREDREERAPTDGQQKSVFTPERVAMLESLAELAGTMLITSSALGKPKGIWDERLRP